MRSVLPRISLPPRSPALLVFLAFGCTVVRAPVSWIAPRIPVRDGVAEPQVELWLESSGAVQAAEGEAAAAEARAVLRRILARRSLEEGDQLLVVRAQGVSRTDGHRSGQELAHDGLMAGAVVGVAVVMVGTILSALDGRDADFSFLSSASEGTAPAPLAAWRRPPPAGGLPPPQPPRAAPFLPRRGPHAGHHPGEEASLGAAASFTLDAAPAEASGPPGEAPAGRAPPPPPSVPPPPPPEIPPPPEAAELPAPPPEAPLAELMLPPLRPLELEERDFWAKDVVKVELLLVDRQTGTPLWIKTVEGEADLRDIARMKALLDEALDAQEGWIPATAPRP